MVRLYYTDEASHEDARLPRFTFPPKQVPLNRLLKKTGVYYCRVDTVNLAEYRKRIDLIRAERKYTYVDDCSYQAGVTKDYEEKMSKWFESHIHDDDEARLVMEGNAYYDIQEAKTSKWIRICMEAGDMLIIPAGCMHRFTPDMKNFVKFRRFFHQQEANTPTFSGDEIDSHPARIEYLKRLLKGSENGNEVGGTECPPLTNGTQQAIDNEIKVRA